jgi:hypothetical protein
MLDFDNHHLRTLGAPDLAWRVRLCPLSLKKYDDRGSLGRHESTTNSCHPGRENRLQRAPRKCKHRARTENAKGAL